MYSIVHKIHLLALVANSVSVKFCAAPDSNWCEAEAECLRALVCATLSCRRKYVCGPPCCVLHIGLLHRLTSVMQSGSFSELKSEPKAGQSSASMMLCTSSSTSSNGRKTTSAGRENTSLRWEALTIMLSMIADGPLCQQPDQGEQHSFRAYSGIPYARGKGSWDRRESFVGTVLCGMVACTCAGVHSLPRHD